MMKKNKIFMASALILLVGLISSISAFGVASPYWEGNPLTMERGETTTINLNLQNMAGEEDVTVKAEINSGQEIISLAENTFIVKKGTSDTLVPVKITIPEDINPGTNTGISIEFKTVNSETGGIALGTGMVISFNVIAGEEINQSSSLKTIGIILGLIVLAIIIKTLLPKKRKK